MLSFHGVTKHVFEMTQQYKEKNSHCLKVMLSITSEHENNFHWNEGSCAALKSLIALYSIIGHIIPQIFHYHCYMIKNVFLLGIDNERMLLNIYVENWSIGIITRKPTDNPWYLWVLYIFVQEIDVYNFCVCYILQLSSL